MELDPALCRQAMLARDARFDGRFFTAVKSTGIYCRPVCPARPPKHENCVFMPSAAAAENAGYRPCLRCRPETAPDSCAWHGTSNTVSRALALIEAGALDSGDVETFAGRLGMGARQLRRLFMLHLGAPPIAVAQTRRVLLAKQLIHETQLPMTEIAFASGFRSVRRFNETFQALFGRPPASLRRELIARGDGSSISINLSYRPPYAWDELLAFLAFRAISGVENVSNGAYHRTIEMDGLGGSISVSDDPDHHRLQATIRFPRLNALSRIIARLKAMFDLAADPQVIGTALSADPHLAPLIANRPGLRVPGAWDPFELAVRAIIGQQVTVVAATRLMGKIVSAHGALLTSAQASTGVDRLFPRPEVLATVSLANMPASRSTTINAIATRYLGDNCLFERGADLAASVRKLCAIRGIGPWTANYIAMRTMREPDAFPVGDVGLLRALDDGDGRPTPSELSDRSEAWRPWRAYAALHLWSSLADAPTPYAQSRKTRETPCAVTA